MKSPGLRIAIGVVAAIAAIGVLRFLLPAKPVASREEIYRIVTGKDDHAIVWCDVDENQEPPTLKMRVVVKYHNVDREPGSEQKSFDWGAFQLPVLPAEARDCEGVFLFVSPAGRCTSLHYIHDGIVTLPRDHPEDEWIFARYGDLVEVAGRL